MLNPDDIKTEGASNGSQATKMTTTISLGSTTASPANMVAMETDTANNNMEIGDTVTLESTMAGSTLLSYVDGAITSTSQHIQS